MAFPSAVNHQITGAVAQADLEVLASSPAVAMANLYQATAQALAQSAQNAADAQQRLNTVAQAVTATGVATLYSLHVTPKRKSRKIFGV